MGAPIFPPPTVPEGSPFSTYSPTLVICCHFGVGGAFPQHVEVLWPGIEPAPQQQPEPLQ